MRAVTANRFTRRLSRAITQSGMNMREVAQRAEVPYGWLRQVKIGGVERPDAKRLARIAGVLGIPADELLVLTDQLGAAEEVHDLDPSPDARLVALLEQMSERMEYLERRADAIEQWARSVTTAPSTPQPDLAAKSRRGQRVGEQIRAESRRRQSAHAPSTE